MRRALAILVVVVAAGIGAMVFRTLDDHHGNGHLDVSGPTGFAVGHMHAVGGPPMPGGGTPDEPLSGYVELRRPRDNATLEKVTVDATGGFRLTLPPGNYYLVGYPSGGSDPLNSERFGITAGRSTDVELVEERV